MNIEKVFQNKKLVYAFTILSAFAILGCMASPAVYQPQVEESSIVGLIVGALVGVVVAVALLPTIANQTASLEADTAGDLDTSEEALIGLWPLLIIVGVMMAIIGMAL